MFCKLSPLEFTKLANFNLHVSSCRSVFTFKISLVQGRLIRDAKGRTKQHNHAFPHITHSIEPPFQLPCCDRNIYDSVTFDCSLPDPCNPLAAKCETTNWA